MFRFRIATFLAWLLSKYKLFCSRKPAYAGNYMGLKIWYVPIEIMIICIRIRIPRGAGVRYSKGSGIWGPGTELAGNSGVSTKVPVPLNILHGIVDCALRVMGYVLGF